MMKMFKIGNINRRSDVNIQTIYFHTSSTYGIDPLGESYFNLLLKIEAEI